MAEKIKYLKGNNKYNVVELSRNFKNEFLDFVRNPELLEQPILVADILFQIIHDLKNYNFHTSDEIFHLNPVKIKENQLKMNLWENEFINESDNEVKKVYKTSQFLKNRDKRKMTAALEFLKEYKKEQYTFTNRKGNKITRSGGLIQDWQYADNTGNFEITLTLYWADKICRLDYKGFFNVNLNVIKQFRKSNGLFFALWILSLKEGVGTKKDYMEIIKSFKLKYKSNYELKRGFISSIKSKMDKSKIKSFNFYTDEKNPNNIKFVPYQIKPNLNISNEHDIEAMEKEKEVYKRNMITYKRKYLKRRHKLELSHLNTLSDLYLSTDLIKFEKMYKSFVQLCRKEGVKSDSYTGQHFINKLQFVYSQNVN